MVLYVAARLAFPDSSEPQDLRKYYASIQGRLWMPVAVVAAKRAIYRLPRAIRRVGNDHAALAEVPDFN